MINMDRKGLENYYLERKINFEQVAETFKKQLFINSLYRIVVFFGTAIGMYYLSNSTPILLTVLIGGIALFLFLVKRHLKLKASLLHNQAMAEINSNETKYLNYDFKGFYDGEKYKIADHPFCLDIDLFGKGSFFQFINRTQLEPSQAKLSSMLLENSIEYIENRQRKIQQLATVNDWCQNFLAEASLVKTDSTEEEVIDWLDIYTPVTSPILRILPYIMSIISIITLVIFAGGVISESIVVLVLLFGLMLSAVKVKKINEIAARMAKAHDLFEQYSKLLARIESKDFPCDIEEYSKAGILPSLTIKQFSRLLNSLNQRNNFMISIFANGFFLRDIWLCAKIDKWVKAHASDVEKWFSVIHEYDKYISLANFAFNHKDASYPKLVVEGLINSRQLGHPLLPKEQRVSNDYEINHQHFNIVTGANMAGKSTFLRTVGLSIVMANSGLPVSANEFHYKPIKLISSMRTSDSLADNASYFFSELSRLRYIVQEISAGEYFVILDEILKGTNSKDKADGSAKFLRKISASGSSGIIATHDLSLCEVANQVPTVHNMYFDAEIKDDELHFDYLLKEGICRNMNASFLMKKMGIVDD